METKLKKGDLLTVHAESVATDYGRTRDFDAIIVDSKPSGDAFNDLRELSKKSIYQVERGDIHEELAKYGVKINQYSVRAERITTFAFVKDDEIRINGTHDIPFDAKPGNLSESFFLDENAAVAIATALNAEELKHLETLQKAVDKGIVTLGQVVDNQMV